MKKISKNRLLAMVSALCTTNPVLLQKWPEFAKMSLMEIELNRSTEVKSNGKNSPRDESRPNSSSSIRSKTENVDSESQSDRLWKTQEPRVLSQSLSEFTPTKSEVDIDKDDQERVVQNRLSNSQLFSAKQLNELNDTSIRHDVTLEVEDGSPADIISEYKAQLNLNGKKTKGNELLQVDFT